MSLCRGLLGLIAGLVIAGAGLAQLPVRLLVEGREPDPVVQQFHSIDPPTFGSGAVDSRAVVDRTHSFALPWPGPQFFTDYLFNHFTMPLGTVPMGD